MTHNTDNPDVSTSIPPRTLDLVELEITTAEAEAIWEECREMHINPAELLRRATQEYLDERKSPPPPPPPAPPVPPPPKPKIRLRHVVGYPPPRASFALSGIVALWTL